MITEYDLQEAIAECEGVKNPNANTCIKLAAFYTIKKELFGDPVQAPPVYSYAGPPDQSAGYVSDTEFGDMVSGLDLAAVMPVMDELMSTLQIVNPRLYEGVIRKINQL